MKKITLVSFMLITFYTFAQSNRNVEDWLFKVNAILPGVSYEFGVGENSTIDTQAIIGFGYRGGGSGFNTEFGIYPGVAVGYRYYYNFNRRLLKDKNITRNSGNYISLLNQFQIGSPVIGDLELSSDYIYNVGAVYGIQRTRPKGFYWSVAFGPGVFVNEFETEAGLLVDLRLGWVIGGRKK